MFSSALCSSWDLPEGSRCGQFLQDFFPLLLLDSHLCYAKLKWREGEERWASSAIIDVRGAAVAFSLPTEANLEFPQAAGVSLVGHPCDFSGHSQGGTPPLSISFFIRGTTLAWFFTYPTAVPPAVFSPASAAAPLTLPAPSWRKLAQGHLSTREPTAYPCIVTIPNNRGAIILFCFLSHPGVSWQSSSLPVHIDTEWIRKLDS